MKEAADSVEVK